MTGAPQSTPARYHQPALLRTLRLVVATALPLLLATATASGQGGRRTLASESDLAKEPGGTTIARLSRGATVTSGTVRGAWVEVTVDGWIAATALKDDRRDGYDVSVSLLAGTPVRATAGGGATLATARVGALFNRVETRSGWVHVRRSAWVARTALQEVPRGAAATPGPAVAAAEPVAGATLAAGTTLAPQPNGTPAATLEAPLRVEVTERRGGWARVKVDAWVRDAAIGDPGTVGLTAADLRAEPDRYIGQTVEWDLQVLSVQKADELRPELPTGQPYLLARGPLPESGFVYVVVTQEEAERFRALEPLAKVKIRATVRAGRSRFLPTPVLTFVRRLN